MARGSINKVIIIGTLGRDPEMRYLPNGNAVCSASLATDEGYKDRNTGQQVDKTEWHRVEAFGRLAEVMGEYLKKGSKVYVEGKLRTDEYEKDGIKRYSTKIIVNEMTMLDSRNSGDSNNMGGGYAPNQGMQQAPQQAAPQQAPQAQPQYAQPQAAPAYGQAPQQAPAAPYGQPQGMPQQAPRQPQQAPQQAPQAQPSNAFDDFDDDIPF
ncbi:MAG: single-stranded DNA-binding protein [Bermanella sp.]